MVRVIKKGRISKDTTVLIRIQVMMIGKAIRSRVIIMVSIIKSINGIMEQMPVCFDQ